VVVPDGTILTLLPEAPQAFNSLTWQRVRTPGGEEGYAATDYFTLWEGDAGN
jgi:hypothetical protein